MLLLAYSESLSSSDDSLPLAALLLSLSLSLSSEDSSLSSDSEPAFFLLALALVCSGRRERGGKYQEAGSGQRTSGREMRTALAAGLAFLS